MGHVYTFQLDLELLCSGWSSPRENISLNANHPCKQHCTLASWTTTTETLLWCPPDAGWCAGLLDAGIKSLFYAVKQLWSNQTIRRPCDSHALRFLSGDFSFPCGSNKSSSPLRWTLLLGLLAFSAGWGSMGCWLQYRPAWLPCAHLTVRWAT